MGENVLITTCKLIRRIVCGSEKETGLALWKNRNDGPYKSVQGDKLNRFITVVNPFVTQDLHC